MRRTLSETRVGRRFVGSGVFLSVAAPFFELSQAHAADVVIHWTQVPGAARDIGVGGGQVYKIGISPRPPHGDAIFRWNGALTGIPWEEMPGAGTRIAVDNQGNPWVVNAQNNIFRWNGSAWIPIPGAAKDIGAYSDPFVIGVYPQPPNGDAVFWWQGAAWKRFDGAGTSVAAGPGMNLGDVWVVNAQGNIWKGNLGLT